MYRSLLDLRFSIDELIKEQGEDAPCAAFIYTKEDVTGSTHFWDQDDEIPEEFIDDVLSDVGSNDWIYEQINECVDDSVKEHKKRQASSITVTTDSATG